MALPRASTAAAPRAGAQPLRPRLTACKFATSGDIAHYLQQEVVIEGVLHVSAAQAGACMERFGDIEALPAAPALPPLDEVLLAKSAAGDSTGPSTAAAATSGAAAGPVRSMSPAQRIANEAFCLATPPDNPAENNGPLRQLQPSAATTRAQQATTTASSSSSAGSGIRANSMPDAAEEPSAAASGRMQPRGIATTTTSRSSTSNDRAGRALLSEEVEELWQLEGAAAGYQFAAARCAESEHALYMSEVLQASAAVRRQRRRALLQLLRRGRTLTSNSLAALQDSPPGQLLASMSSSLSSLSSCEDEQCTFAEDSCEDE